MALSIAGRIAANGTPGWYSAQWHTAVENHLDWLRKHEEVRLVDLTEGLGYQTAGDFYALLSRQGVPEKYHWAFMRINGYDSPEQFQGTDPTATFINPTVLDELYRKVTKS